MKIEIFRSESAFKLVVIGIAFSIILGCGGVAKNPASAPFDGRSDPGRTPGPDQQPSRDGLKAEEEAGAPVIREGASYEELLGTAATSLEGGFIKTASEAYGKAFEENQDRPEAALAYAITKLAGSPKELSVLMTPGIDYFFYSTPLIGRWEVFPAPLAKDDSYLLRIAALGTRYHQKSRIPRQTGPTLPTPPRMTKPKEETQETSTSPSGEMISPDGSTMIPDGNTGSFIVPGGETKGTSQDSRTMQMSESERDLFQDLSTQSGGEQKIVFDGVAGAGEPVQYLNYDKDIYPELIKEFKEIARSYSAGYLSFNAAQSNANDLKRLVDDLVEKMERGRRTVESEDINLEMPFILDKTENSAYKVYFKNYDYMILLGYLRYLQGVLTYQSAYESGNSADMLFEIPKDKDEDGVLSPDEYYPDSPFGELVKDGEEILSDALNRIKSGTSLLVVNLDSLYSDDRALDFRGNQIIPVNVDQFLLDHISEGRDEYSDFQVFTTAEKAKRIFNTTEGRVRIEVSLTGIFGENAPDRVKVLLPNLDPTTFEPISDDDGNIFPDPTWGGIFNEHFDDFNAFRFRNDVKGTITFQGNGIKDVTITTDSGKSGKTNERGEFTIRDVELNKLTGITVNISSDQLDEPQKAQLRNAWVAVDLELLASAMMGQMDPTEDVMTTSEEGTTMYGTDVGEDGQDGVSTGSRIQEIIDGGDEDEEGKEEYVEETEEGLG